MGFPGGCAPRVRAEWGKRLGSGPGGGLVAPRPLAAAALLLLLAPLPLPVGAAAEGFVVAFAAVPQGAPADGEAVAALVALAGAPGRVVEVRAWLEGPGIAGAQVWDGQAWSRSDRYHLRAALDAEGRAVVGIALRAEGAEQGAALRVRVRDAAGGRVLHEAQHVLAAAEGSSIQGLAPPRAVAVGAWRGDALLALAPAHPHAAAPGAWAIPGRFALRAPPDAALRPLAADGAWGPPFAVPAPGALRLQAALVDPVGPDDAEFVRVRNEGTVPVPLAGWGLQGQGWRAVATAGTLQPGQEAAFARDAAAYAALTGRGDALDAVLREGAWSLANAGGDVALVHWGRVVDRLAWGPERVAEPGRLLRRTDAGWDASRSASWAERAPWVGSATVAPFTPGDAYATLHAALDGAQREVLVEVYQFNHPGLAAALHAALDRGVAVRLLVEGAPVAGIPEAQRSLLDGLAHAGAEVRTIGGSGRDRYGTMHAKVTIVDGAVVVLGSENWTPSGFPVHGEGNRGWGARVDSPALAAWFAEVWQEDADLARGDVAAWLPRSAGLRPPDELPVGPPAAAAPAEVRALLVPDNASPEVLALAAGARATLDAMALQFPPAWADGPNPLLEQLRAAAERGVRVRVLLDGSPGSENAATALLLEGWAAEGLPVEARLAREVRVHNKALVVDGREALVGSTNFGQAAMTRNREAALVVRGAPVEAWQASFEEDWAGAAAGPTRAGADPWLVGGVAAGLAALAVARAWSRRS
jgi:cardiolipin synthase A/B